MPEVGLFLLVNVFSAVLPPINPNDRDYYEILGVTKSATNEEIRKAYKKKSLALHPDKVAQRRDQNQEEAAKEYEQVQEAYGILVNEEKRQRYHALQCSPTRYQFVSKGTLTNPGALYENLVAASFVDKTRLIILTSVIIAIVMLQPILIATKINHVVEHRGALQDAKWVTLLIPFWLVDGLVILFWAVVLMFVPAEAKPPVAVTVLEQIAWFLSAISLALKWDGTWDSRYGQIFIPVYFALILRWIQSIMILKKIKHDVNRMVTIDHLEREVLDGKSLEDMTEEERAELFQEHLLVTVPDDFVYEPIGDEVGDDKEIEAAKVEASPEFQAATEIYNDTLESLITSIVLGTIMIALIVSKLDGNIKANWWIVFLPVWIYFGLKLLTSCYMCVCGAVVGSEIVLQMQAEEQDGAPQNGNTETKNDTNNGDASKKDEDEEVGGTTTTTTETTPNNAAAADDDGNKKHADSVAAEVQDQDTQQFTQTASKNNNEGIDMSPSEAPKEQPSLDSKPAAKPDGNTDNDPEDKDEGENIRIDEETFRAFQSAYQEAEQSAMEDQAKAASNCVTVCFQILMTVLVVAKIQKSTDSDSDNAGFNTFWILFPFFLFFGCICLTCTCLIYGASADDAHDDDMDGAELDNNGNTSDTNQQQAPEASTSTTPAASTSNANSSSNNNSTEPDVENQTSLDSVQPEKPQNSQEDSAAAEATNALNNEPEGDIEDID